MKLIRISILLLFTAVLVFSGLVCNANNNLAAASGNFTLTVETDKQSYDGGEPVNVAGALLEDGAVPASNVSVGLILMKEDVAVAFGQTVTGNDGRYALQFSTNSLEPGAYKVVATANLARAEAGFTIREETVPAAYKLTLGTDRTGYSPEQAVEVSGVLLEDNESQTPVPDVAIGLVLYRGDEPVAFAQKTTGADGTFAWTIPAGALETGDYRVYATANTVTAESPFKVSVEQAVKPKIEVYQPAAGAAGVATNTEISATFNVDVTAVDVTGVKIVKVESDGAALDGVSASLSGRVLEISHPVLDNHTVYRVSIPGGAVQSETGLFNDPASWVFETKSSGGGGNGGDGGNGDDDCGSP